MKEKKREGTGIKRRQFQSTMLILCVSGGWLVKLRVHVDATKHALLVPLDALFGNMPRNAQDEADAQWMADVEARNKQQITALTMYEEKCRRLYDTRLKEYVEKTDEQISKYEEKLVQAGVSFASERNRYESKLRRLKIACGKWRVDYQKDMHARYQASLASLEVRYTEELSKLLQELSDARDEMSKMEELVQQKERYLLEERTRYEVIILAFTLQPSLTITVRLICLVL